MRPAIVSLVTSATTTVIHADDKSHGASRERVLVARTAVIRRSRNVLQVWGWYSISMQHVRLTLSVPAQAPLTLHLSLGRLGCSWQRPSFSERHTTVCFSCMSLRPCSLLAWSS